MRRKLLLVLLLMLGISLVAACNGNDEHDNEDNQTDLNIPKGLSDDLRSMQFALNGKVYQLPFYFSEAIEEGWNLGSAFVRADELLPGQRIFAEQVYQADNTASFGMANSTLVPISTMQSQVSEVLITEVDADSGTKFFLPGGITINSSIDELTSIHGNAKTVYEGIESTTYVFIPSEATSVSVRVNTGTGLIDEIKMRNFYGFRGESFDGELSVLASGYTVQDEIGEDTLVGVVKLDNTIYQLPVPIGVMLNNGWELESLSQMIPAGETVRARVRSGTQVMRVTAKNYDLTEVPITDAFVVRIEYSANQWGGNIELPGGVTQASTKSEVLEALGDPTQSIQSNDIFSGYFWSVEQGDERVRIDIMFLAETGEIHLITVERELSALPW